MWLGLGGQQWPGLVGDVQLGAEPLAPLVVGGLDVADAGGAGGAEQEGGHPVPAARARQGMLELCRNLHRLNLLATYRLHQAAHPPT